MPKVYIDGYDDDDGASSSPSASSRRKDAMDLHARAGSDVSIVCRVEDVLWPPAAIRWSGGDAATSKAVMVKCLIDSLSRRYRDGSLIMSEVEPSRTQQQQTKSSSSSTLAFSSSLLLGSAQPSQSGEYTCAPQNPNGVAGELPRAVANLHIVNGQYYYIVYVS